MENSEVAAPRANPDLQAIKDHLYTFIPAGQRGCNEQYLFIFRNGETFIFEYKAKKEEGGVEKKVLLWAMVRGGQLRRLTFKGLSQDAREFEQGCLSWNQKTASWAGEEAFELDVVYRCK